MPGEEGSNRYMSRTQPCGQRPLMAATVSETADLVTQVEATVVAIAMESPDDKVFFSPPSRTLLRRTQVASTLVKTPETWGRRSFRRRFLGEPVEPST